MVVWLVWQCSVVGYRTCSQSGLYWSILDHPTASCHPGAGLYWNCLVSQHSLSQQGTGSGPSGGGGGGEGGGGGGWIGHKDSLEKVEKPVVKKLF